MKQYITLFLFCFIVFLQGGGHPVEENLDGDWQVISNPKTPHEENRAEVQLVVTDQRAFRNPISTERTREPDYQEEYFSSCGLQIPCGWVSSVAFYCFQRAQRETGRVWHFVSSTSFLKKRPEDIKEEESKKD